MFFLAAHTTHCANLERKVPDQLACGQLANLQNILDVMEIVDQQVALVQARDKTCMWTIMVNVNTIIVVVGCIWTAQAAVHNKNSQVSYKQMSDHECVHISKHNSD